MKYIVDEQTAAYLRRLEDLERRIDALIQHPDPEAEAALIAEGRALIAELRAHNQPVPDWAQAPGAPIH